MQNVPTYWCTVLILWWPGSRHSVMLLTGLVWIGVRLNCTLHACTTWVINIIYSISVKPPCFCFTEQYQLQFHFRYYIYSWKISLYTCTSNTIGTIVQQISLSERWAFDDITLWTQPSFSVNNKGACALSLCSSIIYFSCYQGPGLLLCPCAICPTSMKRKWGGGGRGAVADFQDHHQTSNGRARLVLEV